MWGWQMWNGFGWGGWLIGAIIMLLFWGGLIVVGFFAIRAFTRSGSRGAEHYPRPGREDPLEILKQRYARGEISREEYMDMKNDLEK
jgi:putative membrane protein